MLKRGVAETYAEFATDFRFRAMCHRFPTEISDRHPIAVNIAKILEGVRGLDEWLSANFHICASCGTRLPHDGAECPKCGPAEADEDEEDPAAVTCPNCGCCEVDDDGDCKSCLHQKVAPPSDGAPIKTATIGTITYEVEKRGTQWFYRVDEAAGWTCAGAEMAKLIEEGAADE
jgi:hypothetical protein